MHIQLTDIHVDDQFNSRGFFTDQSVTELADSLRAVGMIQPLIVRSRVRALNDDKPYHLVCGHRRFKAAHLLGWKSAQAVVRELTDRDAAIFNIQENLARADLTPSQELEGITRIYGDDPDVYTVAFELKKSRRWVADRLAIRKLDPSVRASVDAGLLTAYDVSILILEDGEAQVGLAEKLLAAHTKGKSTASVLNDTGRRRRVRSRKDIQMMITRLIDEGTEPPGWRCLAWAAGTITDEDLLLERNS